MTTKTSDPSWDYNCIAYAAGDDQHWWWPDPQGTSYWPTGVPREVTLTAFVAVYATLGYEPCDHGSFEREYEKIVLYARGPEPTHAARQLETGYWTSKLGREIDVEHGSPGELLVDIPSLVSQYGMPVQYLRRKRK